MKKMLIAMFCTSFLMLGFTACNSENYDDTDDTLICIDECWGHYYRIFYDKETLVMYVLANNGTLNPLYNAYGTMKTYHKDK